MKHDTPQPRFCRWGWFIPWHWVHFTQRLFNSNISAGAVALGEVCTLQCHSSCRCCCVSYGVLLAGLPASQLSQLQSVLHMAAWLNHGVRRRNHVTPLPQQLHWLSVPERVNFKLCILVYYCLHGLGPEYFSDNFNFVSKIQSHQRLYSASSTDAVPATCRSSFGDCIFLVAGTRAWNALLPSVTSMQSFSAFWWLLKTFLFYRQLRQ